jgi:hypothetical protein
LLNIRGESYDEDENLEIMLGMTFYMVIARLKITSSELCFVSETCLIRSSDKI